MGVVVSKTRSRWGRSRPWLMWMALPYVITSVALFTVPQTSETLQFLYIFVTYNLCTTVCYTAINVPLGSLSTMMTRDSHQRDILSLCVGAGAGWPPDFGHLHHAGCPFVRNDQSAWSRQWLCGAPSRLCC